MEMHGPGDRTGRGSALVRKHHSVRLGRSLVSDPRHSRRKLNSPRRRRAGPNFTTSRPFNTLCRWQSFRWYLRSLQADRAHTDAACSYDYLLRTKAMKGHFTAAILLLAFGISANVHAQDARTEGLNLELTPYFWVAGIDGEVSALGQTVNFDKSFSDVKDNIDGGFMGLGVLSYDRFVLYVDYDYIALSNDAKASGITGILPPGTKVQGNIDTTISTFGGGYRFDTFGTNTIDVLLGARTLSLDKTLKALGTKLANDDSITDTVLMLRPSFQISERWRFNPTLSYGISGDSDTTYELMPQVQYQFSDSFAARFGYKKLSYKQEDGAKNTPRYKQFDGEISGFFIGAGWTFPTR
jgi:hypothetical protein